MVDELLPIGSVVKLNDTNKRLMIYGIKPQSTEDEKIYDYCAVPYPEGFIGDEYLYLFNNEDIELLLYSGYEDEERDYFINNLKKKLEPENAIDMPDKPLKEELEAAKERGELSLIEVKCSIGAREDLGRPTTTALENKQSFMEHLKTL